MPVTAWEDNERDASEGKSGKYSSKWWADGTDEELAAMVAVLNQAPLVWNGNYWRESIHAMQRGPYLWELEVSYGADQAPGGGGGGQTSKNPNDGSWRLSFDTMGGNQHVNQSLRTLQTAKDNQILADKPAPDFKGAVNVSDSGVGGVDIHVPNFVWHEERPIPRSVVDFNYVWTLVRMTARTNEALFRGVFLPGQVLFMGCTGDISSKDPKYYQMKYSFAAGENRTGVLVGGCDPIDKDAWDYLWCLYQDVLNVASGFKIKVPAAVYREQLYLPGDYTQLKIGT